MQHTEREKKKEKSKTRRRGLFSRALKKDEDNDDDDVKPEHNENSFDEITRPFVPVEVAHALWEQVLSQKAFKDFETDKKKKVINFVQDTLIKKLGLLELQKSKKNENDLGKKVSFDLEDDLIKNIEFILFNFNR